MTVLSQQGPDTALLDKARALHKQVPLIDGHNDYPWALRENAARDLDKLDITKPQPTIMTDIARLRAGGVGGQFWSVYVPADLAGQAAVTAALEQIDIVHRMMRKYPETFELALTADDVERIFKKGKIASLIGMEGGHAIDNSLGALRMFHRLGPAPVGGIGTGGEKPGERVARIRGARKTPYHFTQLCESGFIVALRIE